MTPARPERSRAASSGPPKARRMTDAEFKVVREHLGLTGDWLAGHLNVEPRTLRRWEFGERGIPDRVRLDLEDLQRRTADFVAGTVAGLLDTPDPEVTTYRNDQEYHACAGWTGLPASWHRAAVARVALEVPGLVVVFPSADGDDRGDAAACRGEGAGG